MKNAELYARGRVALVFTIEKQKKINCTFGSEYFYAVPPIIFEFLVTYNFDPRVIKIFREIK